LTRQVEIFLTDGHNSDSERITSISERPYNGTIETIKANALTEINLYNVPETAGYCQIDVAYANGEQAEITPILTNLEKTTINLPQDGIK